LEGFWRTEAPKGTEAAWKPETGVEGWKANPPWGTSLVRKKFTRSRIRQQPGKNLRI
jgi:hypothetical protein